MNGRNKRFIKSAVLCVASAVLLTITSVVSTYLSDIYSTESFISAAYLGEEDGGQVYYEVDGVYDFYSDGWVEGGIPPTQYITLPWNTAYDGAATSPIGAELIEVTTAPHRVENQPLFVESELIATTAEPDKTETTTTAATSMKTASSDAEATTAAATPDSGVNTTKKPFINFGDISYCYDDDVYTTMIKLVNDARAEQGIAPLKYSAEVHEVAQLRATEISSYYTHQRPDGTSFYTAFTQLGINYGTCGENIAYGLNAFETPDEVFRAWMASPSHYKNIMNDKFECVGFGFVKLKNGAKTYYYWSQEFASFD